MRRCFDMVTTESADIMGLKDYGLAVGKRADLVVLDAGNPIEAVRLRATRLMVMARGKVIARRERSPMHIAMPGRRGGDRPALRGSEVRLVESAAISSDKPDRWPELTLEKAQRVHSNT
jgi:cytosine/adenosine deaminase-related metal-dependent hydrolase